MADIDALHAELRVLRLSAGAPSAEPEAASVGAVPSTSGPAAVSPSQRERLLTLFGALSDPTRLEMFEVIVQRGDVGCAEFDERFPLSKSTISYHTKILSAAGLIETRREGKFFFYRPVLDGLEADFPGLLGRLGAHD
jgi:DNA-binding transcriptional ArsR family regulator